MRYLSMHVFVDSATLQDLEAVPTPLVRGATLWSLIDRTRTRVGGEALRRRLVAPRHLPSEILALQHAHRTLAANAAAYRQALDGTGADEVERYLSLTWQLPADMPSVPRARKWYREYAQDAERGRTFVTALLRSALHLSDTASSSDAALLREIGGAIANIMQEPVVRDLCRRGSSSDSLSQFDQVARGPAQSSLLRLLQSVGELESLWSVGVATAEHAWTYPQLASQLRVTGLVHPLLGGAAVANDLHLDPAVRVCFVTGPNMAGKSTFLRAIGLAVLLAHIGGGVPAASMEFAPVALLFSSIQIAGSSSAGESFYLAEVRRVGKLASELHEQGSAVAVIDEPFRGTNVHDASEATLAIVTRLAAHPAALVFVASHVAEVVPAIRQDPRISLLNFAADLSGSEPVFDYRLHDGVSEQRLGMTFLRQEGVLEQLERSAKSAVLSAPGRPLRDA